MNEESNKAKINTGAMAATSLCGIKYNSKTNQLQVNNSDEEYILKKVINTSFKKASEKYISLQWQMLIKRK